ncbi:hypothetical protein ACH495_29510 [Micromonospora sp. NPDC018662]|uniref:hypothetical protein n=1 Tax=Micromonospora sp. NPDC018662 TaxID=3364238 RepID=UPI00379D8732
MTRNRSSGDLLRSPDLCGHGIATGLRRAERHPADAIGVADIAAARSEQAGGRITVTVTHVAGSTHRFSGTGMAGARTAQLFARLLSPAAPPRDTAAPPAAATVAGGADTTA